MPSPIPTLPLHWMGVWERDSTMPCISCQHMYICKCEYARTIHNCLPEGAKVSSVSHSRDHQRPHTMKTWVGRGGLLQKEWGGGGGGGGGGGDIMPLHFMPLLDSWYYLSAKGMSANAMNGIFDLTSKMVAMCSYRQDGCHVVLPAGRLPCGLTGRTVAMWSYRQDGCHVVLPAGRLPCALTGRTVAMCSYRQDGCHVLLPAGRLPCALTGRTVAMCSYRQDGCHVLLPAGRLPCALTGRTVAMCW